MGKKKHDKLAIRDLIEVEFGVIYRFKDYRENFFLWLTSNFCVSKDDHKSKSKVTVFSALPALPGTTSPSLYIGTVEGVFFWVFNDIDCIGFSSASVFFYRAVH
jgi:hypothetical protein